MIVILAFVGGVLVGVGAHWYWTLRRTITKEIAAGQDVYEVFQGDVLRYSGPDVAEAKRQRVLHDADLWKNGVNRH